MIDLKKTQANYQMKSFLSIAGTTLNEVSDYLSLDTSSMIVKHLYVSFSTRRKLKSLHPMYKYAQGQPKLVVDGYIPSRQKYCCI